MYKILIIEDDPSLSSTIIIELKKWDFDTSGIEHFDDILPEFVAFQPHLVIMDINLPYYDGFYWCRKMREISDLPLIFLSSRDSNHDIIMAVNLGGDDYITKPFSMEVLIAKVNAMLRRAYDYQDHAADTIECRGAVLHLGEGILHYHQSRLELTRNELKILSLLMKNQGKIISRDRIMRYLWDNDEFVNDNTLTVNINRLRSKLEGIGLDEFIHTKKGSGYLIT